MLNLETQRNLGVVNTIQLAGCDTNTHWFIIDVEAETRGRLGVMGGTVQGDELLQLVGSFAVIQDPRWLVWQI